MQAYEQLEVEFAQWLRLDPKGMVACNSGTAALHLAFEAMDLGVQNGSVVLMSDYNMIACPRAAVLAGLVPKFVDCNDKLLIDPHRAYDAATTNLEAILATHVYGRQCDMEHLHVIANDYKCRLIEDLAEAHWVRPHADTDASCWSFYQNKLIAGQEGGAVYFKEAAHAAVARRLRCLGFTDSHDYSHLPRGHNYRLANCLAGKVLASLRRAGASHSCRKQNVKVYDEHCPAYWRMPERQSPWVYDLRVPGLSRDKQTAIVRALRENGIAARHGFKPMTWQPEFLIDRPGHPGPCPNAAKAAYEVIYLPCSNDKLVTNQQAQKCFDIIQKAIKQSQQ